MPRPFLPPLGLLYLDTGGILKDNFKSLIVEKLTSLSISIMTDGLHII
jgi:hypothetical protein